MQAKIVAALAVLAVLLVSAHALNNGVALTPAMGWNSWNHFGCNINENLIMQTIDQVVSTGLKAKGYEYVNLDDCWQVDRDKVPAHWCADWLIS